jgi:hypothetical protein
MIAMSNDRNKNNRQEDVEMMKMIDKNNSAVVEN